MSSTEAELMALAALALELLNIRAVLAFLGHEFADKDEIQVSDPEAHRMLHKARMVHGATEAGTDNKGAYDLCRSATITPVARHVERKVLKMRELHGQGVADVILVPTAENVVDLMTKALDNQTFLKHRATILNTAALPAK